MHVVRNCLLRWDGWVAKRLKQSLFTPKARVRVSNRVHCVKLISGDTSGVKPISLTQTLNCSSIYVIIPFHMIELTLWKQFYSNILSQTPVFVHRPIFHRFLPFKPNRIVSADNRYCLFSGVGVLDSQTKTHHFSTIL